MPEATAQTNVSQLIDHLFRHEAGKMVSILTRVFGSDNIDLAEDVVQDSLVEAMSHWQYRGVPDNPSAWLFRVAKNKALNVLNREKYKRKYSSEVTPILESENAAGPAFDNLFSAPEILDDQLRMIFTCCHPAISADSQIALALKTLCGFSIPEIASAFLTNEENVNKRLVRARQKIREDNIPFEVPQGKELENRLQTVLETIYLLFNEGYSASKGADIVRYELCEESMRLAQMLADSNIIERKGNVYALLSLMFLNASRFKARQGREGNLLTMAEQDRALWDTGMRNMGLFYWEEATRDNDISIYHILAAISMAYCVAPDYESTDWRTILSLYNSLVLLDDSPLVLLNRAIAVSKVDGPSKALEELELLINNPALLSYHYFYSTRAEFYDMLGRFDDAAMSLETAIRMAPLEAEKKLLQKKLDATRKK